MSSSTRVVSIVLVAWFAIAITPAGAQELPLDGAGRPKGIVYRGMAEFAQRYGVDFTVRMNEATGYARLVFGRPIASPSAAPPTSNEFDLVARTLIDENETLFGVRSADLVSDGVTVAPLSLVGMTDKIAAHFHQRVSHLDVRGSHVTVLFLEDGTITGIDTDVWPDAVTVNPLPTLSPEAATDLAQQDLALRRQAHALPEGTPALVIEPHLTNGYSDSRLGWMVTLAAHMGTQAPVRERIVVDAHSGEVLTRDNLVHDADIIGTLQGWATPGTKPDLAANPEVLIGINKDTVTATGVGNTTTDLTGNFAFTGVGAGNYTVSSALNGPYCFVQNSQGSEATVSGTFTTGVPGTLTFNTVLTEERTAEVNAYKWVLSMRDWIVGVDPSFDLMGFKVTANVNLASTCNAFYDGVSINFYRSGGGCVNTAYSSVILHENGHWANDMANSGNGSDGFGEGGADIWAMYQLDNAIVGEDFCGTGCNIRTGENTRQFCGDANPGCYGEVHADGEVLMGAAWKVRKRLDTSLGDAAGDATANALMLAWFKTFDDGQIKTIVRDHWLMLDDTDGNIDNGTPHYADIDNGFHDQGFPNYVKKPISIVHTPLPDTSNTTGPYIAVAKITGNVGNSITTAELHYDVGAGFVTVTMTPTGNPNEYAGNIPGQAAPKMISYYLRAVDNLGNTRTAPDNAPGSGTYRFGVGNLDDYFFADDFESAGDNGWTHAKNGGGSSIDDWQHGNPVNSGYSGDPHAAFSGTKIWGNDISLSGASDGLYEPNSTNHLTSPAINCTGKVGVHLQFMRWLSIEQGIYDNSYVQVSNDGTNYTTVFANVDGQHTLDNAWSLQTFDISLYADNKASVRIRFRLESDGGLEFGGWNLDDAKLVALSGGADTQPPGAPSSLSSPDHSVNVWSNNATTTVTWAAPSDPGGSGVDGYSVIWDHSTATDPDTVKDIEEAPLSYVQTLSTSASGWYFHIRAKDNAGNCGTSSHFGPILIDTASPGNAGSLSSPDHTVNVWSSNPLVTTNWTAATDAESGLDGYSVVWDHNASTTPDTTKDLEETATSFQQSLASSSNGWYFHIRAVDNVGNWGSAVHFGPVLIDTASPGTASSLTSPDHTVNVWSSNPLVTTNWTAATDAESGLDGYSVVWDHSAATTPDTTKDLEETATSFQQSLASSSNGWYFHIRAVDNVGNWGSAVHFGPVLIDTASPGSASSLTSPDHTVNVWSSNPLVTTNWTAATDAESGLDGYSVVWDHSAATTPDTTKDLEETATSFQQSLASSSNGWYFHIRAVDNVGNWGSAVHFGPVLIDTASPGGVSGLTSPDHTINAWSTDPLVTTSWTSATDAESGLDGYSVVWDHSASTAPDMIKDLEETATSYQESLQSSPDGWYFHIRAADNVGNWGSAVHFGPILIDTVAPSGSVAINNGATTTTSLLVTLNLNAVDLDSGLDAGATMQFSNDGVSYSAEEPFATVKSNWDLSQFGGNGDPGTKTVYVRVRDVAGNQSNAFSDTIDYAPVPTVNAVSPDHGPYIGGTSVAITGTGFTPASTVKFGATAATSVTYLSSTQLIAVTPAYGSGLFGSFGSRVNVAVTTNGGSGVLPLGYRYQP